MFQTLVALMIFREVVEAEVAHRLLCFAKSYDWATVLSIAHQVLVVAVVAHLKPAFRPVQDFLSFSWAAIEVERGSHRVAAAGETAYPVFDTAVVALCLLRVALLQRPAAETLETPQYLLDPIFYPNLADTGGIFYRPRQHADQL